MAKLHTIYLSTVVRPLVVVIRHTRFGAPHYDTVHTRVIIIGCTLRWINSTWTKREMEKKKKQKRVHFVVYFENIYLNFRFEHLLWHCRRRASDAGYDMRPNKMENKKKNIKYKFVLLSLRQCHPSRKRYVQYSTCSTAQKLVCYGCRFISFHFVWNVCVRLNNNPAIMI